MVLRWFVRTAIAGVHVGVGIVNVHGVDAVSDTDVKVEESR
jgi:hypothetical protein